MTIVLSHDKYRRVTDVEGNLYVEVEQDAGTHHQTVRADALRFARDCLGDNAHLGAYLGHVYYRRFDGHPATARRYSVVLIGPAIVRIK